MPQSPIKLGGMAMASEIGKQVGARIKQFREARGLTQAQLADILGKSIETISNFERGKVLTSIHTLEQLARHLNVAVKDFFTDEAPAPMATDDLSKHAQAVRNALAVLTEDDLEVLAGVADVLQARRRRKRGE